MANSKVVQNSAQNLKIMQSATWLFQSGQHVSWGPTKILTLTNIIQYIAKYVHYHTYFYYITYFYYFYIIIIYKCILIDKYFTHLHKIVVDELVHSKDYEGHNSIFHWFDFDLDLEFDY